MQVHEARSIKNSAHDCEKIATYLFQEGRMNATLPWRAANQISIPRGQGKVRGIFPGSPDNMGLSESSSNVENLSSLAGLAVFVSTCQQRSDESKRVGNRVLRNG